MAKRSSNREMLETGIRGPQRNGKPLAALADPPDSAGFGDGGLFGFSLMADGYRAAGDLMVAEASRSPPARELLVFPIIFNYRLFLELSLKFLLAAYGRPAGIELDWSMRDLAMLRRTVLQMIRKYGIATPEDAGSVAEEIFLAFAKVDPRSCSLRLPVDGNGKSLPVAPDELDLPELADAVAAMSAYFDKCDACLDNLGGAGEIQVRKETET